MKKLFSREEIEQLVKDSLFRGLPDPSPTDTGCGDSIADKVLAVLRPALDREEMVEALAEGVKRGDTREQLNAALPPTPALDALRTMRRHLDGGFSLDDRLPPDHSGFRPLKPAVVLREVLAISNEAIALVEATAQLRAPSPARLRDRAFALGFLSGFCAGLAADSEEDAEPAGFSTGVLLGLAARSAGVTPC
jgi:hypothetical protein